RGAGGRPRARVPPVLRAVAAARPPGRGAHRCRDRLRVVLLAAAPSPAGASLSRLPRRRSPGDRAGRAREPLPAALGRHLRRPAARGRVGPRTRARAGRVVRSFPVNRHRAWQLVFDAILIAAAWRLTFFLRFDKQTPIYYRHFLDLGVIALVVAISLGTFIV